MGTCYIQHLLRELELEEAFEQFSGGWKAKTVTSKVLRGQRETMWAIEVTVETASSAGL